MSTKVASLYAEIGANTTSFEKGAQKVKGSLSALAPGIEKARTSLTSFVSANAGLISIFAGVGLAMNKVIGDTVSYANEVRKLALVSGTGAEESSRLLQVMDDFKISSEQVTAATRKLTAQGLSPTTETLAQLSDEFLQLNPGTERAAFLMENFGRAGQDFAEVMSKGGDAIRQMSDAVNDNLILDEKALQEAREYELAVDDLHDAWQGFTMFMGQAAIPALTNLLKVQDDGARAAELAAEKGINLAAASRNQQRHFLELAEAERVSTNALQAQTETTEEATEAARKNAEALEKSKELNSLYVGTLGSVDSALDDYNEGLQDSRQALADGKISIEEHRAAVGKLAATYQEKKNEIILSILEMKLAADGWTDAEVNAYLTTGEQLGVFAEGTRTATMGIINNASELVEKFESVGENATGVVAPAFDTISEGADGLASALSKPVGQAADLNGELTALPNSGSAWEYWFTIHTKGHVPNLPTFSESDTASGGSTGVEMRAGGGYLNMGEGAISSVGEQGEEGIIRTDRGLYVIPANEWRKMKAGGLKAGKGYQLGGRFESGDTREAKQAQHEKVGLGSLPVSTSPAATTTTATPGVSMNATATSAGQSMVNSQNMQTLNSAQSVVALNSIDQKLSILIGKTSNAHEIASAARAQQSKFS